MYAGGGSSLVGSNEWTMASDSEAWAPVDGGAVVVVVLVPDVGAMGRGREPD